MSGGIVALGRSEVELAAGGSIPFAGGIERALHAAQGVMISRRRRLVLRIVFGVGEGDIPRSRRRHRAGLKNPILPGANVKRRADPEAFGLREVRIVNGGGG